MLERLTAPLCDAVRADEEASSEGTAVPGRDDSHSLLAALDAANLFPAGTLPRQREILAEAFALLGKHIIMAHAKDLSHDGEAGHEAAGTGLLDYDHYLSLLHSVRFNGPLILHSLAEPQVEQAVRFLRARLEIAVSQRKHDREISNS